MVDSAPILHLYTPGVLDALSEAEAATAAIPDVPAMERFLSRAHVEPAAAERLDAMLLAAFGVAPGTGVAPFAYLGDRGVPRGRYCMRADPVYLQADQDRLLLFAGDGLDVRDAEAQQLAALVNDHFQDRGWRFEAVTPERWYLCLEQAPDVHTVPLDQVVGRDINARLPGGPHGSHWRAALNEVQMLLHENPMNQQRQQRGALPINSVWFWGGGCLPAGGNARWAGVGSDESLALGLASHGGSHHAALPPGLAVWLQGAGPGPHLMVSERLRRSLASAQLQEWRDGVLALERDWLAPALEELRRGRLARLHWWPGGRCVYTAERSHLRRFWRRRRPLSLTAADSAVHGCLK